MPEIPESRNPGIASCLLRLPAALLRCNVRRHMAEPEEPIVETCPGCGTLIDVSEAEPLAMLHCPACGNGMRVRRLFDHFELQEVLGAGGMGAVYRAIDRNLNRAVALKLLRREYSADAEFVAQFENEASITASINHPNVVKVFSAGNDHGLIYIAMELVDKGSLDDLMTLQGRVAEAQVLEVGMQIAKGLNAALLRGLIHRDVKPGNILFADAHTAKIVDFGLAVLQEHAGRVAGEIWGTPYYVAPEKLDNSPEDFRSDMYSLGATLFHAVAGRPPFEAETASLVALKHLRSEAVSLQAFAPDVSSATAFVINKTLSKDPDDRYQSYGELIEHLEYARRQVLEATTAGPQRRARLQLESEESQRAMSWVTFAMVAVVVIGGLVLFTMRDKFFASKPPDPLAKATEVRKAALTFEPEYQAARKEIIAGNFQAAAAAFHALGEKPGVPQPLLNWITLHEGLATLLDARENEARAVFGRIEARGLFSPEPAERRLAHFFMDLAAQMKGSQIVPPDAAKDFEKTNFEALGLLLLALKDWHLGHFEEGGALFRQFQSSTPQAPYDWIAQYKELAARFIGDFTVYRNSAEAVKAADTLEKRRKALATLRAGRVLLKLDGPLTAKFEALTKALEDEIRNSEEAEMKRAAEHEDADGAILLEIKQKLAALSREYRFSEAQKLVANASLKSAKAKREQEALAKKMEWLTEFRTGLIADLANTKCTTPVVRKSASVVPPDTVRATDARVEIITPYGILPIPWADITPESLFAVARSLITPGLDPSVAAPRQWRLGVFALFTGKKSEGEALVTEAAQAKAEYKEALPLLLAANE